MRYAADLFAVSLVCISFLGARAGAGEKVFVGKSRPQKLVSIEKVSHDSWSALLKKYVDEDGQVNYAGWKASPKDRQQLANYLTALSVADPRSNAGKNAKLAYWINAYNALTIHGMLRVYPTTSIRNHTAKLFGFNIWKDLQLRVGGKAVSLDDIEHNILRKMNEPRIHFAVVCASKSCPRLLNEAYSADQVNDQLESNAKDFFSRPANFLHEGNRFRLSSILKWYGEDFGNDIQSQLKTISPWLPVAAQKMAKQGRVRVSYLSYDWTINEQSKKKQALN